MAIKIPKPAANAIVGAQTAGMTTLWATPCQRTPSSPAWATAAPMSPPIRACDDDDGTPNHHVIRFHVMPPSKAASRGWFVMAPRSMIPLLIVYATGVGTKAPARFATEAIRTARRGDNGRVDTDVA